MPDLQFLTSGPVPWTAAIALPAVAALLYAFDPPIMAAVQRVRSRASDRVAKLVKPLGDGRYTLPPLAIFFLIGWIARWPWSTRTYALCLISFFLTGLVCQGLQMLTRRQRPDTSITARDWHGPSLRSPHRSFPSGHASASASVLVVLGLLAQGHHPWLALLCYLLTALTALSRLNDKAHWPSDVFTGVTIGTLIALATVMCPWFPG